MYSDGHRIVQQRGEPTAGGAYATFVVGNGVPFRTLGKIQFQSDTIPNIGVQGWTNECVLAVVIDRLRSFQASPFACEENAIALRACQDALASLESRTARRLAQGIEGTHTTDPVEENQ